MTVGAAIDSPALLVHGGRPHHVAALDGLRGVAILMVMIFHMSAIGFVARPDRPWIDAAWLRVAMLGWSGVDLFFVLSGLLITGILLDAKDAGGDRRRYFGSFYARRALRVWPLYYAVVCFALLVLPHVPNAKSDRFGSIRGDEGWYWALLSNWIIGYRHAFRHGILDVTWSLSIEEQFYLLWPVVVLLSSRRTLGWICGGLMVLSVVSRTGLYLFSGSHEAMHVTMLTWTPCRMDGLAAGSALAVLARRPGGLAAWRRTAWWALAITGAAIATLQICQGDNWTGNAPGECLGYTVLAVGFAAATTLAATASTSSVLGRILGAAPLRQLGRFSYALYLLHNPIRGVVRDRVYRPERFLTWGRSQLPGQAIFYALAMSASLAAAWVSWHALEKHALRLKRFAPVPGRQGCDGDR